MLNLSKNLPDFVTVWLVAPTVNPASEGAWIKVRPATQFEAEAVHARVQDQIQGLVSGSEAAADLVDKLGPQFAVLSDDELTADRLKAAAVTLAEIELVMLCHDGWHGIGVEDTPAPVPTPALVGLLLRDPVFHNRILSVLNAGVHKASAEKNGSAGLPIGMPATEKAPVEPVAK